MRSSLITTVGAIIAAACLTSLITMPANGIRMNYMEIASLATCMVLGLAILVMGINKFLDERRSNFHFALNEVVNTDSRPRT